MILSRGIGSFRLARATSSILFPQMSLTQPQQHPSPSNALDNKNERYYPQQLQCMAVRYFGIKATKLQKRITAIEKEPYLAAKAAGNSIHPFVRNKFARTHLVFGANTDVGKTLTSAGLVRASLREHTDAVGNSDNNDVHYIKPLQCGGSDISFIETHCLPSAPNKNKLHSKTLFSWDTPASPHIAARKENLPRSDEEVLGALRSTLSVIAQESSEDHPSTAWIETAGGVLSPSSSSPDNNSHQHASAADNSWGWVTQGDLYKPLRGSASVVLCGDGRLGGISATLSSLESLMIRGYNVAGIVFLETGYDNVSAIREYAGRQESLRSASGIHLLGNPEASIVSLPQIPPEPEPLHDWYDSAEVVETLDGFNAFLKEHWNEEV